MKKMICWLTAAAVLLIGLLIYFQPLAFTDVVTQKHQISMMLSVFSIQNGEPDIEVTEYQEITAEQKSAVITALDACRYRRTFGTLFSDGTLEDLGKRMLSIHVFDETTVDSIVLTDSGKIAINDRSYRMSEAEELIGCILELMEQEG